MKRLLCIVFALLLVFSLAACKTRAPEEKPEKKPEESKPLTAQELWEQAEKLEDAYTSMVYTMNVKMDLHMGELLDYGTNADLKVEGFDLQGDNPSYRVTQEFFGQKESFTYVSGVAYADLLLGTYQQKMTPELFYAMAISDPEEADASDFTPDRFGKVEIVKENAEGYTLAFSEPSEEMLADMMGNSDTLSDPKSTFTGEVLLDAEGNYRSLTATATFTGTAGEHPVEMTMTAALTVDSFNQPVAIGLPSGASKFTEVENLDGITAVSGNLVSQCGSPTGNLYKLNSLQVTAGDSTTLLQQQNMLSYRIGDSLTMSFAQEYTENGQSLGTSTETYEDGTYTLTVNGEVQDQEVKEADIRAYIKAFPLDWLDAVYYATSLEVIEEQGTRTLKVTPDKEFSISMVNGMARMLLVDEFCEALAASTDWTFTEQALAMTVSAEESGVAVAAKIVAKVTVNGEPLDITLQYMMAPITNNGSSAA